MEGMKQFPDKYFELAIVDPPYGIGEDGGKDRRGKSKHTKKDWDKNRPNKKYFDELKRVSINQIIWGGNYFVEFIIPKMGWICWDKKLYNSDYSDFELAWTSFDVGAKIFIHAKNGGSRTAAALADIIHPCQKPIKLYEWLLINYAKQGDKILDTHGGSFSSAIACRNAGFEYIVFEIDTEYFIKGKKRMNITPIQRNLLSRMGQK